MPASNYERQRNERYGLRALFYALWLRQQGHAPEEAAELVAERYPRLREQLRQAMADRNRATERVRTDGQ